MMNPNPFILVLHKSESSDVRRGCVVESYSSDFEVFDRLDRPGLVTLLAKCLDHNLNLKPGEAEYSTYVWKDGVRILHSGCAQSDRSVGLEWSDALEAQEVADVQEGESIHSEALARARDNDRERKAKLQRDKELAAQIEHRRNLQLQRQEYERLKKLFEPQGETPA